MNNIRLMNSNFFIIFSFQQNKLYPNGPIIITAGTIPHSVVYFMFTWFKRLKVQNGKTQKNNNTLVKIVSLKPRWWWNWLSLLSQEKWKYNKTVLDGRFAFASPMGPQIQSTNNHMLIVNKYEIELLSEL